MQFIVTTTSKGTTMATLTEIIRRKNAAYAKRRQEQTVDALRSELADLPEAKKRAILAAKKAYEAELDYIEVSFDKRKIDIEYELRKVDRANNVISVIA